jgi:hypothetical protein
LIAFVVNIVVSPLVSICVPVFLTTGYIHLRRLSIGNLA